MVLRFIPKPVRRTAAAGFALAVVAGCTPATIQHTIPEPTRYGSNYFPRGGVVVEGPQPVTQIEYICRWGHQDTGRGVVAGTFGGGEWLIVDRNGNVAGKCPDRDRGIPPLRQAWANGNMSRAACVYMPKQQTLANGRVIDLEPRDHIVRLDCGEGFHAPPRYTVHH